ncbi:MAG: hypothetical protein JJ979_03325 [Roseibium sp.]|nr:hypothetical protein [Roseibium sp.]
MMHRNVDRLRAEEDYRLATVGIYTASGEHIQELLGDLRKQMGTVIVLDEGRAAMERAKEERDVDGLKSIAGLNKGV